MVLALIIVLAVSLLIQVYLVHGFVKVLRSPQPQLLSDVDCPEAAVVLCLRGGDPFLARCLSGLLSQDYPNYRVLFIVDHPSDPALPLLEQALQGHAFRNFEIQFLQSPLTTCSLKCSSILQAYRSLPESTRFIAQLDADTIPHPTWLRELATGLMPEDVGAATGNRWYMPDHPTAGSLVRYIWNAAAIVQMTWYRIAWGGTLAVKVSAIRDAKLDERWALALCEDTMLSSQLRKIRKRVAFVPSLMMVNREECDLKSFIPWVSRQLLTARLYHPAWPAVVGHGFSSAAILLWGWGWGVWLAAVGQGRESAVVLGAMAIFQLSLIAIVPWIVQAVEHPIKLRGESTQWPKPSIFTLAWIVTLTQWVYTWALIHCVSTRIVSWRGIDYKLKGSWNLQMLHYRPYADSKSTTDASSQASL